MGYMIRVTCVLSNFEPFRARGLPTAVHGRKWWQRRQRDTTDLIPSGAHIYFITRCNLSAEERTYWKNISHLTYTQKGSACFTVIHQQMYMVYHWSYISNRISFIWSTPRNVYKHCVFRIAYIIYVQVIGTWIFLMMFWTHVHYVPLCHMFRGFISQNKWTLNHTHKVVQSYANSLNEYVLFG